MRRSGPTQFAKSVLRISSIGAVIASAMIGLFCLTWDLIFFDSPEALAAEEACQVPVLEPDASVLLGIPDEVPEQEYSEIEKRVRRRASLLGVSDCFVNRKENRIIVQVVYENGHAVSIDELHHILSRRGFLEAVDAKLVIGEQTLDPVPLTIDVFGTPEAVTSVGPVIFDSDDIERVFTTPTEDGIEQVAFLLSDEAYLRLRNFVNSGNEFGRIAFFSDGTYWFTCTLNGPFPDRDPWLLIGGIDQSTFDRIAVYLAVDTYPAELSVLH